MSIIIKSPAQLEHMRRAGKLAASVLEMIAPYVVAGTTTNRLDQLCHEFIVDEIDCIPAPLNYGGMPGTRTPFPKSICTSLNNVVCHGIPNDKALKNGDILNIDVTVIKDGYHGDTSNMFFIGEPSIKAKRLCSITRQSMVRGIKAVKPGATLGDIGHAIQQYVEAHRYSVVRDFCGHGIGEGFHEEPQVLHYGSPGKGSKLAAGMCFTIEPMVNVGKYPVRILADGWTAVTRDRSLSAQYEHTIAVTETGYEVLTLRSDEDDL